MIIDEKFLDKGEVLKNYSVLIDMVSQMYRSKHSKVLVLATDAELAQMSMILNDRYFYSEIMDLVDRSLTDFEWTILASRDVYKYTYSKIKELYGYDYRHAKAIYEKGSRKLVARYMRFKSSYEKKNKEIFTDYSIEMDNLSDTERFEELVKQKGPAVAFAGYLQGEFPKAESSIIDNGLKALKEMQDAYFKRESK